MRDIDSNGQKCRDEIRRKPTDFSANHRPMTSYSWTRSARGVAFSILVGSNGVLQRATRPTARRLKARQARLTNEIERRSIKRIVRHALKLKTWSNLWRLMMLAVSQDVEPFQDAVGHA
jgi:hypothetical protein